MPLKHIKCYEKKIAPDLQYAPDRELAGTREQSGSGKEKNFCPAERQILSLVFWNST
jgi:hypothetical protein